MAYLCDFFKNVSGFETILENIGVNRHSDVPDVR